MMYQGCSNLVFQPARTLVAIAAFNKEVLVLKLSSFTRKVKQKRRKNCVWENEFDRLFLIRTSDISISLLLV